MSKLENITISTGITRYKKKQIVSALVHNHRLENSHRNIKNNNTNYFFNFKTMSIEEITTTTTKALGREEMRKKAYSLHDKHHKKQMELMSARNAEKGLNKPKAKDLNPIAEGIVNFGNVYDIRNATDEERKAKTEQFNNQYTREEWVELFNDIKNNLMQFAIEENCELLDITLHTDEEGLYHVHYLMTNYNQKTGEHLNVRQNKGGIGDRLQDKIAENMEVWGLGRAKGRKSKKNLSKEELTELREVKDELKQTKEQLRALEKSTKAVMEEAYQVIEILKVFINELSTIDPNDKYGAKKKVEALYKSAQYAIGKNKMEVAIHKLDHLEKIIRAMEKKGNAEGLSNKLDSMRKPTMPSKPIE